ncbi:hypothetical protein G3N95_31250 [Paraburkholderia sp. Tr-20389]|uniref:hypothetical protein n=1 Tax=Paraburkholderia sp. Tr-20389 TaxID=2703903 RepID=UPI00197DDFFE|nr:hypothetical protein [Paraburkholderia sp. Tr-20389]MBN3757446.1 hypothetical protein [Paraburkholderia sp. Tr-20389]
MGFFDGLKSAWSTVRSVASSVIETAKDVAGRVIGWMAEEAEQFVGDVKQMWQTVKPFVEHIRTGLRAAAGIAPFPWLKGALTALDAGLGALTAFENSPIAKKVEEAIKWAIELAKRWHKPVRGEVQASGQEASTLSDEELVVAKRHQQTFRFAEREVVSDSLRHELGLASAINDFEIASIDVTKAIDAAPADFEHYLRLRATQKLLTMAEKKFRSAGTVDDLSADDLFLVRIASDLVKAKPELSIETALRLDRLLTDRYGKKLTPFVFEELIAAWAKRGEVLGQQWNEANRTYAKDKILLKRLTLAKEIQEELSEEETLELSKLEKEVPAKKTALDQLATRQLDTERYAGAAEGFLQLLEKTPEQIEAEDRSYLIDEGANVGKILIDCAQNEIPFDKLSADNQALVNDYANIFKNESKQRTEVILKAAA